MARYKHIDTSPRFIAGLGGEVTRLFGQILLLCDRQGGRPPGKSSGHV